MRILIVDDRAENLYLLETLFKGSGYEVVSAKNGVEALDELKKDSIDMIISDILMPRMDGFQLCRECKTDESLREIPFVFYTAAYTERKDEEFALSLGAAKFIVKPVEPDVFLKILESVIEEHRKGALIAPKRPIEEEAVYLAEYNKRLVKKLNKEVQDLERANKKLKESEEALRRSEQFIKNILESVGEGFSVVDREYRVVTANKAYGDQFKVSIEDIMGKHCYELSHQTDRPCYETGTECPAKHTFETGEPHTVTHTHRDKEGNPVYVEVRSYPMKDASGDVVSVIKVTNDITEKRKLEDQLRHAQKMEAVGRLAGGVAHDFNNILTAIIGYGNILQMKIGEGDPVRVYVNQILGASEKAAHLTQSLLAFSRRQIIRPMPVNLNEIIERVEKLLLRLIGEDIELKMTLTDRDFTIMADSGQIEQVLMNLATNARDAMPEGGLITISTELMELDDKFIKAHGYDVKPGVYSVLSVTDTGAGMDEDTRKRIFEPFFTTKEVGKGTGLGLSIIYGIVRQHNGYINVYSEPNKGTTFKIYLPVIKSVIEETERATLPPPRGGTETVLLAEDDEAVRELIRVVLDRFGYKVIGAVDGEDAVIKFKENRDIELVILDVIMPKKDGKTAYQDMKKVRPEIKAIFTSGYSTDIIDEKGVLEEGVNFIPKPVLPNDLLRKVREVLDG